VHPAAGKPLAGLEKHEQQVDGQRDGHHPKSIARHVRNANNAEQHERNDQRQDKARKADIPAVQRERRVRAPGPRPGLQRDVRKAVMGGTDTDPQRCAKQAQGQTRPAREGSIRRLCRRADNRGTRYVVFSQIAKFPGLT